MRVYVFIHAEVLSNRNGSIEAPRSPT